MTESDVWIKVEPESANIAQIETFKGIQVKVCASPHDVPVAVKGRFDGGCDRFVIMLRYVDRDDSPLVPELSPDGVIRVFKGGLSGRVERIEVDTNRCDASEVALNIEVESPTSHLIDKVEERLNQMRVVQKSIASRLNYLAVSEALEQSREMLTAR